MGDGSTLRVVDTPFGRIGGLICWRTTCRSRVSPVRTSVDIGWPRRSPAVMVGREHAAHRAGEPVYVIA